MEKITCIIVDDEPLAARLIESYVLKTPFLELKGCFNRGAAAFEYLQNNPVDLLFCDIQMPSLNGMELSRMLPERTRVIFITAFSEYAVEGFRVRALDYLLKPVSYDDFLSAAGKARDCFTRREATASAEDKQPKSIFVKTEYRLQQIELDRILYIEGFKDYVRIQLDGDPSAVLSLMRLKTLEDSLPAVRFVRVHKSYIVQTGRIEAIERNHIIMGKERIPIGESYREALREALSGTAILPAEK